MSEAPAAASALYNSTVNTTLRIVGAVGANIIAPPLPQPLRNLLTETDWKATQAPVALTSPGATSGWMHAAHAAATRTLKVLVLGASVTAGCGSAEPPLQVRCFNNMSLSQWCNQTGAWVRHFVDALDDELHAEGWPNAIGSTAIYSRNAVSVKYFARCTAGFVAEAGAAHLVLLDVAQLEANLAHDLAVVMRALRAQPLTSRAAFVFVAWRTHANLFHPFDRAIHNVSSTNGMDVLNVYLLVQKLLRHWESRPSLIAEYRRSECAYPPTRDLARADALLYALRGNDIVHPSPEGHLLMGRATAQFVARRLIEHSPRAANGHTRHAAASSARATDKSGEDGVRGGGSVGGQQWERCYGTADRLPRAAQSTSEDWQLTDTGLAKGVRKLGLTSTHAGDILALRIRLPPSQHGATSDGDGSGSGSGSGSVGGRDGGEDAKIGAGEHCNATIAKGNMHFRRFSIELGYRLSTRLSHGAIVMTCGGCYCRRQYNLLAKELAPFPGVETNARLNSNWHYREETFDATITATTAFNAYVPEGMRECFLNVTHEKACSALSTRAKADCRATRANMTDPAVNLSVVTIDTLSVWCDPGDGAN